MTTRWQHCSAEKAARCWEGDLCPRERGSPPAFCDWAPWGLSLMGKTAVGAMTVPGASETLFISIASYDPHSRFCEIALLEPSSPFYRWEQVSKEGTEAGPKSSNGRAQDLLSALSTPPCIWNSGGESSRVCLPRCWCRGPRGGGVRRVCMRP